MISCAGQYVYSFQHFIRISATSEYATQVKTSIII